MKTTSHGSREISLGSRVWTRVRQRMACQKQRTAGWTIPAGLVSAALLASIAIGLGATVRSNPFLSIVERNAFALKPRVTQTASPPVMHPPVEVFLTGISTLGGKKQVLLQITDKTPGKKTEFPPPLVEGDVWGRVKVVSIAPRTGAVVISIEGAEQTLTFEKNAPKQTPAAAPRVLTSVPAGNPQRILPTSAATTRNPATGLVNRQNVVVGGGGMSTTAVTPGFPRAFGSR
jgi:hypothetical protein